MCTWGTDAFVTLNRPREVSGRTVIAVDACIAPAVQRLNDEGLWTLGCCCGHGQYPAHVLIRPESVEDAQRPGYAVLPEGTDGPYPSIRVAAQGSEEESHG
jgi:hypothetical protein